MVLLVLIREHKVKLCRKQKLDIKLMKNLDKKFITNKQWLKTVLATIKDPELHFVLLLILRQPLFKTSKLEVMQV